MSSPTRPIGDSTAKSPLIHPPPEMLQQNVSTTLPEDHETTHKRQQGENGKPPNPAIDNGLQAPPPSAGNNKEGTGISRNNKSNGATWFLRNRHQYDFHPAILGLRVPGVVYSLPGMVTLPRTGDHSLPLPSNPGPWAAGPASTEAPKTRKHKQGEHHARLVKTGSFGAAPNPFSTLGNKERELDPLEALFYSPRALDPTITRCTRRPAKPPVPMCSLAIHRAMAAWRGVTGIKFRQELLSGQSTTMGQQIGDPAYRLVGPGELTSGYPTNSEDERVRRRTHWNTRTQSPSGSYVKYGSANGRTKHAESFTRPSRAYITTDASSHWSMEDAVFPPVSRFNVAQAITKAKKVNISPHQVRVPGPPPGLTHPSQVRILGPPPGLARPSQVCEKQDLSTQVSCRPPVRRKPVPKWIPSPVDEGKEEMGEKNDAGDVVTENLVANLKHEVEQATVGLEKKLDEGVTKMLAQNDSVIATGWMGSSLPISGKTQGIRKGVTFSGDVVRHAIVKHTSTKPLLVKDSSSAPLGYLAQLPKSILQTDSAFPGQEPFVTPKEAIKEKKEAAADGPAKFRAAKHVSSHPAMDLVVPVLRRGRSLPKLSKPW